MTKEELSQYIYDKIIPVSFVWDDDVEYSVFCRIYPYSTEINIYKNNYHFPKWGINNNIGSRLYFFTDFYNHVFNVEKNVIEECLGEFLIWWEINKGRCKSIEYYKQ